MPDQEEPQAGDVHAPLPSEAMQAEDQSRGLQPSPDVDIQNLRKERESQTARMLALTLVWVLIGIFVIHYIVTATLGIWHPEAVQTLKEIFNTAFPVFSGLVGTAVGFYLKERK